MRQLSKETIKERMRIKREDDERRKKYKKGIMDGWKRWKGQTEKERKTWEEV